MIKDYAVYIDETDDEIKSIEALGYTLGYTEETVNEAKEYYEYLLSKIIKP